MRRFAWRYAAGAALGLAILIVALHDVEVGALARAAGNARPGWVALALVSVALNTLLKVARWRTLLGPQAAHVSFGDLLRVLLAGQMVNTLVPARAGDLARAWLLGRQQSHGQPPQGAFVLGSVLLEKVVDLLAYGLCAALVAFLVPLPLWLRRPVMGLGALALAGLVVVMTLLVGQASVRGHLARLRPRWRAWAESALDSLDVLRQAGSLGTLWAWTVLVWATAVLNNYLLFYAFDLSLPLSAALLLVVGLQASVSVPALPGGLGLFEVLCVWSLALFGIGRVAALSYGMTLHLLVLGLPVLLGGILLWRDGDRVPDSGNSSTP